MQRHAEAALELASGAESEGLRAHYAKIDEICTHLIDGALRILREAIQ